MARDLDRYKDGIRLTMSLETIIFAIHVSTVIPYLITLLQQSVESSEAPGV